MNTPAFSAQLLEAINIFDESIKEVKAGIADAPVETLRLCEKLLNALIPACESMDRSLSSNPSLLLKGERESAHARLDMFGFLRDEVFGLVSKVHKHNITDVAEIPRLITDSEIRRDNEKYYVYSDRDKLLATRANALIMYEALGTQLGIAQQLLAHYKQNSPLFTRPENIALAASKGQGKA